MPRRSRLLHPVGGGGLFLFPTRCSILVDSPHVLTCHSWASLPVQRVLLSRPMKESRDYRGMRTAPYSVAPPETKDMRLACASTLLLLLQPSQRPTRKV